MPKLPVIKVRQLIKVLNKLGFIKTRQVGSHQFFKHPDGRATVVPFHPTEDLGKGLLRKILNQIEISPDKLSELLKK